MGRAPGGFCRVTQQFLLQTFGYNDEVQEVYITSYEGSRLHGQDDYLLTDQVRPDPSLPKGYNPTSTAAMTMEKCIMMCSGKGHAKVEVEFATQCYYDNAVGATTAAPIEDCTKMFCSGNSTQFSTAASRMLLYSTQSVFHFLISLFRIMLCFYTIIYNFWGEVFGGIKVFW